MHRRLSVLGYCLLLACHVRAAPEPAPGHPGPVLRLQAGGPTAPVKALAFSPDGKTLYVAGWDKVIRVYTLRGGKFVPDKDATLRVPVGPGLSGALNTLALSDDGQWLAAAGRGASRFEPGFQQSGIWAPGMAAEGRHRDEGTIYLFNTRTRAVRLLRGHRGHLDVGALCFAPTRKGEVPLLCSVAREETGKEATRVARVWKLGKEVESREWWTDLPGTPGRVGLAVWYGGEGGKDLWAALSLGDNRFRARNLEGGKQREWDNLPRTVTAVALPGKSECLTAGYRLRKARLRLWRFPSGADPVARKPDVTLDADALPRALALLSSGGDGKADRAALVLQGRDNQMRLQLLDLHSEPPGKVRVNRPLWPGVREPILATSLRGRHLAVAGNQAHEVWIFSIDERGQLGAKPQKIASALTTFRHASFVRARGKKDLGLLLNTSPRKRPGEDPPDPDGRRGDWVFDFKAGALTDEPSGWETVVPPTGGWRAEVARGKESDSLIVRQGGVRKRRIDLSTGNRVVDYALLGPRPHGIALLAVAASFYFQPNLMLYNAESGEQVRSFSGHSGPLSAVAFSPDGRFLVSAADDQTVCVWSLTDLKTILGVHGRLPGVTVRMEKGALTVARVEEDSPVKGKLFPEDVITAVGDEKRLDSARAYYLAFHRLKPGNPVVLRVKGKAPLRVRVAQTIDERKPLLSLALAREGPVAARDWIAWNPFGPYETSRPRAERYLGWLFNTGKAEEPTRFGTAEANHNLFYRKGLLHDSIQKGEVIEKAELPLPKLGRVVVAGEDVLAPAGPDAKVVVGEPEVKVWVSVRERALYTLEKVTWKSEGGKETPLPLDGPPDRPLSFALRLPPRKDHHVTLTAYTSEVPPRTVSEPLLLRYQPPPATVTPLWKASPVKVEREAFSFAAEVKPGLPGEGVRVTLHDWHGGKDLLGKSGKSIDYPKGSAWPVRVSQKVKLKEGENRLVVEAVNLGVAGKPGWEEETGRAELVVDFTRKDEPPVFTFARTPAGGGPTVLGTDLPAVRLRGKVSAGKELFEVEWDRGPRGKWVRVGKFKPGAARVFELDETLSGLKPDRQSVRFRARTKNSDWRVHEVVVEYRPRLPQVFLKPLGQDTILGKKAEETYPLRGTLEFPEDRHPFRAVLLVNGKEQATWPVDKAGRDGPSLRINEETGALTGVVRVRPGENRIQVRLSNDWQAAPVHDDVRIYYGRPPRVEGMKRIAVGKDRPTVDIEARVWSPVGLVKDSIEVTVNRQKAQVGRVLLKRAGDITTVTLEGVVLQAGTKRDTIRLRASNAEAAMPEGEYGELVIDKKETFPPPVATFHALPGRVSTSPLPVTFDVHSKSRLTEVKLLWWDANRKRHPREKSLDLKAGVPEGTDTLRFSTEVELAEGFNSIAVLAINQGGQNDLSRKGRVSYVLPPIRLTLDALVPGGPGRRPLRDFERDEGGWLVSTRRSSSGRVLLQGRILWHDAEAREQRRVKNDWEIRVYANGFQQSPARLLWNKGTPTETPFEATLLLNRKKNNEIHLRAAKEDPGKRINLRLDCANPVTDQRLHLLVLSPHRENVPDLSVFETPAFKGRVFRYGGPLVENAVNWKAITRRLDQIKAQVFRMSPTEPPCTDVVLIYYRGAERLGTQGAVLEAQPGHTRHFDIYSEKLEKYLATIPGAHVLLVDVERARAEKPRESRDFFVNVPEPDPETAFHVSVLRYSWTGKKVVPDAARLIVSFRKALRKESQLAELVRSMEDLTRGILEGNPQLIITKYVPPGLADLRLGE